MAHYPVLLLKVFCVFTGAFLIVSRIFMFEKTQGMIQSRIENLWIKVDDYQQKALSKHVAFIKVVSGAMTSILDRTFGPRLLSLQALTVSVCYAVATCSVTVTLLLRYSQKHWSKQFFGNHISLLVCWNDSVAS